MRPQSSVNTSLLAVSRGARPSERLPVYFFVNREAFSTCDCDTASGEHLYGRFELLDPVRGCRVELRLVADRQGEEKRKTRTLLHTDKFTWVTFALDCIWLHKNQEIQICVQMLASDSPLEVILSSQMSKNCGTRMFQTVWIICTFAVVGFRQFSNQNWNNIEKSISGVKHSDWGSKAIWMNCCKEALWLERAGRTISGVMHSVGLPGNRAVVLGKVYQVDGKGHGAHCQHVHNFEGREPHLGERQRRHRERDEMCSC